ncbi:MAG: hypothetical protein LBE22_10425 [Azoarcus sp.]|jgi:hypothetical protein|nr:hypothetical protein [Azoarcus sp.]
MISTKTVDLGNGRIITVTATCTVSDDISYSDGWNINLGRKISRKVVCSVEKDGKNICSGDFCQVVTPDEKQRYPAAVGSIADSIYLGAESFEKVKTAYDAAVAEAEEPEAKELDAKEKARVEALDEMYTKYEPTQRPYGWCDKCQSCCYGDCEAA